MVSVEMTNLRQTRDNQQSETEVILEDMFGPVWPVSSGSTCLMEARLTLCYLKDACLLYNLTKPPLIFLPSHSGGAEHRETKETLYISKPAVISWKRLTASQVWERESEG